MYESQPTLCDIKAVEHSYAQSYILNNHALIKRYICKRKKIIYNTYRVKFLELVFKSSAALFRPLAGGFDCLNLESLYYRLASVLVVADVHVTPAFSLIGTWTFFPNVGVVLLQ